MKDNIVILAGAAPDTANLGVNALCYSSVSGLLEHSPDLEVVVLTHGKQLVPNGYKIKRDSYCHTMGAKLSRRWYAPSSFRNIEIASHFPVIQTKQKTIFSRAKAILDISGGDSYTDLYGARRFEAIAYPKKLAVTYGKPLILLPQTYGPFADPEIKKLAQVYLRYASYAFARDRHSFAYMQELLGSEFDSEKHKQTVDVAFLLPYSSDAVLQEKGLVVPAVISGREVYGINVSGLIYCDPAAAKSQYQIRIDYKRLLIQVIETLLKESDGEIWLIPHVLAQVGHYESDTEACEDLKSQLPESLHSRITIVHGEFDQCDIKAVIRRCNWFCGTRMHATIAALSSGVPTLGLAYSGKFIGVFESVGQGHNVADARTEDEQDIFEKIIASWRKRTVERSVLQESMPKIITSANAEMKTIAQAVSPKG
jgi:colanic acid/amylovoran biosynthesis protein